MAAAAGSLIGGMSCIGVTGMLSGTFYISQL